MFKNIATLLAGIGLFFFGMRMVGNEIINLSGLRMRSLFLKCTQNRLISFIGGFISGAITQSTSNASLIITNIVSSGLISVRNALPIVAASNIGTVLLVFLVSVNIKVGVLFILGITSILYSLNKKVREKPYTGVILGIGVLLFGFSMFENEAKTIFMLQEVRNSLVFLKNDYFYYISPFLLGLLLRFFTQSTSTVSVLAISLCHAGAIDIEQTLFIVFGAPLGSVVTLLIASVNFRGAAKQVSFFQILFESTGTIIMSSLLIMQIVFHIPVVKSFLTVLSSEIEGQIAFALLIMRVIPFIISMFLLDKLVRILEKRIPYSREETLMKAVYIYDGAIEEPKTEW